MTFIDPKLAAEVRRQGVPVSAELAPLSAGRLAEIRNRKFDEVTAGPWLVADGDGGRPVVYVERSMSDGRAGAFVLLAADGASESDVQFVASARRSVPELIAEVERLRVRVSELEKERHVTNEALSEAAEALRAHRDEPAPLIEGSDGITRLIAPTQALREDPHDSPLHHAYRIPHDLPPLGGAW